MVYPFDATTAVGAVVLGVGTLVNWGFVMFSDHWYGDLLRGISKSWFNLGRNTESVISPAAGLLFISAGTCLLLFPYGPEPGVCDDILVSISFIGGGAVFFLFVAVVGLIPFRLPGPMYPEWQLERRRRRAREAVRANRDHADGGVASWGRHAARPEPTTDVGGHDGQHAGDAGGEDPLKSSDSLPMRARSPRDEDSDGGPGGGMNI